MANYKLPKVKPLVVTDELEDLNQQIKDLEQDFHVKEIDVVFKEERLLYNQIKGSTDAHDFLKEVIGDGLEVQEHFVVLYMNHANKVIGYYKHTKGTINSTQVDIEIIVAVALKVLAKAVIFCHNHPSGNPQPSEADRHMTKKVKAAFNYFDIAVLDHMILTRNGHYSFADEAEPSLAGLGTVWQFVAKEVFGSMFQKLLEYAGRKGGKNTTRSNLSGSSSLESELRTEILKQLKKVTMANSPMIYAQMQSKQGYARIESQIIQRMISQRLVPAAVIPQLETQLNLD
jgi:DNA repair protein RadC